MRNIYGALSASWRYDLCTHYGAEIPIDQKPSTIMDEYVPYADITMENTSIKECDVVCYKRKLLVC